MLVSYVPSPPDQQTQRKRRRHLQQEQPLQSQSQSTNPYGPFAALLGHGGSFADEPALSLGEEAEDDEEELLVDAEEEEAGLAPGRDEDGEADRAECADVEAECDDALEGSGAAPLLAARHARRSDRCNRRVFAIVDTVPMNPQ